jgi:hypothetical protein
MSGRNRVRRRSATAGLRRKVPQCCARAARQRTRRTSAAVDGDRNRSEIPGRREERVVHSIGRSSTAFCLRLPAG